MFWSENVPKFIFHLAYLTSPYSHPSILVPLTYELEQYFSSKRYPSIGNRSPTANLSRTSKQSDLHKVLPLRFSFIKCGGGRPLTCRETGARRRVYPAQSEQIMLVAYENTQYSSSSKSWEQPRNDAEYTQAQVHARKSVVFLQSRSSQATPRLKKSPLQRDKTWEWHGNDASIHKITNAETYKHTVTHTRAK